MGLVFASRRTWIEPEHFAAICKGDGLRQLLATESPQRGDIVVYQRAVGSEVIHVGVVWEVGLWLGASQSVTVLSKWGFIGEYFHDVRDVPAQFGSPLQYWTDRERAA